MPTLTKFLSSRPTLAGADTETLAAARELCLTHLVNQHRANASDEHLNPASVAQWRREAEAALENHELSADDLGELEELYDALEADGGSQAWTQDVLMVLGLAAGQHPGEDVRSAMVHLHRHGSVPTDATWLPTPHTVIAQLMNSGQLEEDDYGVARNTALKLTEMGVSTAGILVPRVLRLAPDRGLMTGRDAWSVMVTPAGTDGSRTAVKFVVPDWF